jgi:hypothetical protein
VEREVLEPDRGSSPTAARSVSVIGTLRLSPLFVMRLQEPAKTSPSLTNSSVARLLTECDPLS